MMLTGGRKYRYRPTGGACSHLANAWFVRHDGGMVEECVVFCPDEDPEVVIVMTADEFVDNLERLTMRSQTQ